MDLKELKRTVGPLTRRISHACDRLSASPDASGDPAEQAAMLRSLGLTLTCVLQGHDPAEAVGRPFSLRKTEGAYELRYGRRPVPVESFTLRDALTAVELELMPGEAMLVDAAWATILMKAALALIGERTERIGREFSSFSPPMFHSGYSLLRENARVLRETIFIASRILHRRREAA